MTIDQNINNNIDKIKIIGTKLLYKAQEPRQIFKKLAPSILSLHLRARPCPPYRYEHGPIFCDHE